MTPFNEKVWSYMVKFRPRASDELREKIRVALERRKERERPKEKPKKKVRYCK